MAAQSKQPDPKDWITPGANLNRVLDGVVNRSAHSADHGPEFGLPPGDTAAFRSFASQSIAGSTKGAQVKDAAGNTGFVLGNPGDGSVTRIRTNTPEASTMFKNRNPDKYVENLILSGKERAQAIDPPAIRAQALAAQSRSAPKSVAPPASQKTLPASTGSVAPPSSGRAAPHGSSVAPTAQRPPSSPAKAPNPPGGPPGGPR